MKLLYKDLLLEYGFVANNNKTDEQIEVMSRNGINIILKNGNSFYYFKQGGMQFPLKDFAALRKLYKELRNEELKPVIYKKNV